MIAQRPVGEVGLVVDLHHCSFDAEPIHLGQRQRQNIRTLCDAGSMAKQIGDG